MEERIFITRETGESVYALAPVIVSASRATDIPAFYSQWFINRIKAGYCVWYNPFNQHPSYISFQNCRAIVFWTKNPKPMIPYLDFLDQKGLNYYFQYTLNDYSKEGFEPGLGSLEARVKTFKDLANRIGKERVIWRFDPIIITPDMPPREVLKRIWKVGSLLKGFTNKLVFSFVDVAAYRKVQSNLVKETSIFTRDNVVSAESTNEQIIEIAAGLEKCRAKWREEGWDISLATCGEKVDLSQYGIEHNRCIDGELLKKLFSDDRDLVYYINYGKLPDYQSLFAEDRLKSVLSPEAIKDKGQRKECGCMISKDIGMYNTCLHNCVYCYANTSRDLVAKNAKLANPNSESIIPPSTAI